MPPRKVNATPEDAKAVWEAMLAKGEQPTIRKVAGGVTPAAASDAIETERPERRRLGSRHSHRITAGSPSGPHITLRSQKARPNSRSASPTLG
jgi:hypothetical protein